MPNKVTLIDGTSFDCNEGETIFSAALRNGYTLEHSCLTAQCESCRCSIIEGLTEPLNNTLKQKEIAIAGDILTCNAIPQTDVRIGVEDLTKYGIPRVQTLPAKISSISTLNENVILLQLRLPPRRKFEFLPGQYVDINAKGVKRSYSIAGFEKDKNLLKFYIKYYEGGKMSDYLFSQAKINDLVQVNGPKGTFFIRPTQKRKIFLATGTGIAPFVAMFNHGNVDPSASLYWGMRYKTDFFDLTFDQESSTYFNSVLSKPDDDWNGLVGYVQDVASSLEQDITDCEIYACGNPDMIAEAKVKLVKIGLPDNQFYSDAFVPSV